MAQRLHVGAAGLSLYYGNIMFLLMISLYNYYIPDGIRLINVQLFLMSLSFAYIVVYTAVKIHHELVKLGTRHGRSLRYCYSIVWVYGLKESCTFLHIFFFLVEPLLMSVLDHLLHIDYLISLSVAVAS